jgi:hypothetical protein
MGDGEKLLRYNYILLCRGKTGNDLESMKLEGKCGYSIFAVI